MLCGRNACSGNQFKGSLIWCFASCVFDCKVIIKIKNNPLWQICFQKVSLSFSIISEKYCPIVLTPIECFDHGLMYYPVFPVIQMPPPFVLGEEHENVKRSFGNPTFIPRQMWHIKFRIGWKPRANNCYWKVIVQMQIHDRRNHLPMWLWIAGSNFICPGQSSKWDENPAVGASSIVDKFVQDVIAVNMRDMGQRKLSTHSRYDSLNDKLCVQTVMELLNNRLHKYEHGKLK